MEKYKIAANFKYGRVWGTFALSTVIFLVLTTTLGFAFFAGFVLWRENLSASIFILIFDVFLIGLFVFEIIKGCKNRVYTRKCVKDAVATKTRVKFCDKDNNLGLNYKGIKVSVSFHYENKKIRRYSGYGKIFERYIDKEVAILYSPTYDEVLLCEIENDKKNDKKNDEEISA